MSMIIKLRPTEKTGFAEDKDEARNIRLAIVLPALEKRESLVLDFKDVTFATQSYIHALIGEALKKHGESALDFIEFRNCSSQLQSLIELVVDYSLGGFADMPISDSNRAEVAG